MIEKAMKMGDSLFKFKGSFVPAGDVQSAVDNIYCFELPTLEEATSRCAEKLYELYAKALVAEACGIHWRVRPEIMALDDKFRYYFRVHFWNENGVVSVR